MNIIGISAFYHESACCLIQDGRLMAAAAEERFSRVKHDPRLPARAFRYCLREGGIGPGDVDCLAYYELPELKAERQRWAGPPRGMSEPFHPDPGLPELAVREGLGYKGAIRFYPHHLAHAASAYFFSGFPEAAILTVDGVGEWTTTAYGRGDGDRLELFEEVRFPHSLGLLYATITAYLGFRVNRGEYKVMGLAAYGQPRYKAEMRRLVQSGPGGQFSLDMRYFDFLQGETMYGPALCDLFGRPAREPEAPLEPFHRDLACSVQRVLEEVLLEKVAYLREMVDSEQLCLAGGVALNAVANGRVLREGPFRRMFVQPAAGDAGGCLGAAALAHRELIGERLRQETPLDVLLGPHFTNEQIARLLAAAGMAGLDYRGREAALATEVAGRLAAGEIVGWFQGRMEFGPRALGARSILADPRDPHAQERLNRTVKFREAFRPFAPSVPAEVAGAHFDLDHEAPTMLETCRVTSPLMLPAITHVDGSARPQTVRRVEHPRFHALLTAFSALTGCPLLLNTSFNVRGEPIVCTPVDALICFARAGLDALALEDFLLTREMLPEYWPELLPALAGREATESEGALQEKLYTFV